MGAKGQPKSGGRQKNTPNKYTQDLMAKCEAAGVDPFEMMLQYLTEPCPINLRFNVLKEISSYLYPKRKALEVSGKIDAIEVIIRDYTSKK